MHSQSLGHWLHFSQQRVGVVPGVGFQVAVSAVHRWLACDAALGDDPRAVLVQYIVLGFIACISVTSLRGLLRNMRKVGRILRPPTA